MEMIDVIRKPFTNPQAHPQNRAARMPPPMPQPDTMHIVPMVPENARIAPTDRSIPPETMISVIPSAMMLITAVCRTTLERLTAVRK